MRKLIYVLIFCFLLIGNLYPQLTGGLVSVYNSPENKDDISRFIKTDAQGNMFVAGNTVKSELNRDYLLIKFDSQGKLLWSRNYNGTSNANDTVRDLHIDLQGNIYITGSSQGTKGVYNAVTIKYDTQGNELWAARFNEDIFATSHATRVISDKNLNIYVVGTYIKGFTHDCLLLKYDRNGNLLWKTTANGSANLYDEGLALAISPDMNHVYMGAIFNEIDGGQNFTVLKYNNNGDLEWISSYNGTANGEDHIGDITTDENGNIYGCGISEGRGTKNDITTVKFSQDGVILWTKLFDGPGHDMDWVTVIKLDKNKNVYVAGGYRPENLQNNACVIKYSNDGEFKWIASYDGLNHWHDCCQGLDIDGDLNVYMSGRTSVDGIQESDNIFTIKVNKDGVKLWTKIYDGSDNNADYSSNLIYNKISKTIFTLGHSYSNSSKYDVILLKYKEKNLIYDVDNSTTGVSTIYKTELANYPNPFNPSTKIQFTIPKDDFVKLYVYDLSGRLIKNLIDGYTTAGNHNITFDGSNLSSGVYFYTLQTSSNKITNKFILNK